MTPEQAIRRQKELDGERANWATYWEELASFCLPRKSHVISSAGPNKALDAQRDFHKIFDNTAITSLKTMAAGFHSHLTHPSSKWFELRMKDKELMKDKDVKVWLKDVEEEIFGTLNDSNFDAIIQEDYLDLGCFGTGSIFIEEDIKTKVRFTMLPIGETFIEEDAQGRVNRIYRKFEYTILQAYERWGDKLSADTVKAYNEKKYSKMVEILHWIVPREQRVAGKEDGQNMEYESKWAEIKNAHLIHEGGFKEFPVATGRFTKESGEKWGFSPAMDIMADIRMINAEKKVLIRAAMKIVDPPVQMPSRSFVMPLNFNPSGINYHNAQMTGDGIRPILTKANIPIGLEMIQDVKNSIEDGFFVKLFKAFSQITKQMTIPEVQRRISENMVLLGPVVGRFTQEVLNSVIIRTFNIEFRNGFLPPVPAAIEGREFDVVYISQLAKAQRASEILSLERTLTTVGAMAEIIPSVIDKIDGDKAVDMIAEIHGVNPELIRDDEEVLAIRQAQAEAAAKAQEQADTAQAAETAEKISKTQKNLEPAGVKK